MPERVRTYWMTTGKSAATSAFSEMIGGPMSTVGGGQRIRDVRVGPKVSQIGSKWDKSGTFCDQF